MSMVGMLYGFAARDMGMAAAVDNTTKNLDDINNLLDEQSEIAGKSKITDLMEKLNTFNLGQISGSLQELTGDTGNLSNGLESMAAANAKAIRPMIAAMNLSADASKKLQGRVSSMAISMEVGADSVMDTFRVMKTASKDTKEAIDAMGLSEKEWVKVTETTGMKMGDFSQVLGDMRTSWNASPEDAADMVNSLVAIGKEAGTGVAALKGMPAFYGTINKTFAELGPNMQRSAKDISNLMKNTAKLGGAFIGMGMDQDKAQESAQAASQMFAEQAVAMEKMYETGSGTVDDLPIYKALQKLGMTSDEAKDLIETGSRDSGAALAMLNKTFVKMGGKDAPAVEYALNELSKALTDGGDGIRYLAGNTTGGAAALAKMNAMTVDGADALKKYGNQAFSTGRTLQASLDLAKESFETKLRSIARKDVRRFVGAQMKAYKTVGKDIKKLGSDKTWGPIVKRLSAVGQLGVKGFFIPFKEGNKELTEEQKKTNAAMAKTAVYVGVLTDSVWGAVKAVGPLGTLLAGLGPVMSPLGKMMKGGTLHKGILGIAKGFKILGAVLFGWPMLIAAAIAGLVLLVIHFDKVKNVVADVMNFVSKKLDMAANWFDNLDTDKIVKNVEDFLGDIVDAIIDFFSGGGEMKKVDGKLSSAADRFGKSVERFFLSAFDFLKRLGTSIGKRLDEVDWDKVAAAIGKGLRDAFDRVGEFVGDKGGMIIGLIDKALDAAANIDWGKVREKLSAGLSVMFRGLVQYFDLVKEFSDAMREKWNKLDVQGWFKGVQTKIAAFFINFIPEAKKFVADFFKNIIAFMKGETSEGGAAAADAWASAAWSILKTIGTVLWDVAIGILGALSTVVIGLIDLLITVAWEALKGLWSIMVTGVEKAIEGVVAIVQNAGEWWANLFEPLTTWLSEMPAKLMEWVAGIGPGLVEAGASIINFMLEGIEAAWDTGKDKVLGVLGKLGDLWPQNSPAEDKDSPLGDLQHDGALILDEMLIGIQGQQEAFQEGFAKVLTDSMDFAVLAYEGRIKDLMAKSKVLEQVGRKITSQLTGKVNLGDAPEIKSEFKTDMKALLSIPGMAGVTAAIVVEGSRTRKILKNIEKNTADIVTNTKGFTERGSVTVTALPG